MALQMSDGDDDHFDGARSVYDLIREAPKHQAPGTRIPRD
jgi:hypothetical protein